MALGRLPELHKDPFDRILVAQAIAERMTLVTKDARLQQYDVATIW
jgi:PIN domain nuclease of toxin-antitoxin system